MMIVRIFELDLERIEAHLFRRSLTVYTRGVNARLAVLDHKVNVSLYYRGIRGPALVAHQASTLHICESHLTISEW